jgi:N-acetylglucosaminyldiphosphoundecaprenol N-acetyl-beta-D-mannosaminyltransferase
MRDTLQRIEEFIRTGSFHQIATANVDYLVNAATNQKFREILQGCDLVPDSMPLVLASRFLGRRLRERVAGVDLVPLLAELSRQKGYGIFLLYAKTEVSEAAARRLRDLGARIVGRLAPPVLPFSELSRDEILAAIEKASPDILLVAMGSPKQEVWIHQHRLWLNAPVCIGIGGSLDFLAGPVRRAPVWMRQVGLEWVQRMREEPSRLTPRFLRDAIWLARHFVGHLALDTATRRSA